MALWVILSYILHIFLMFCTTAKYFAYSTNERQQMEDVRICIQMKTKQDCEPNISLHFMFQLYNENIKYRLKRADMELNDDLPVFHLKGGELYPMSIDDISKESGLMSQQLYKGKNSTIILACYSTADAQHKYQLSGVFQQNGTFWAILPSPKQNGSDEKKSDFFLGEEDMCFQHRIFKLLSGHFFSLSQGDHIRTKRSVSLSKYVIDLTFLIDSTVVDFFLKSMPSVWEISSSKFSFILKEYYYFLLLTMNNFFQNILPTHYEVKIKCPMIVYLSSSQLSDWVKLITYNVTDENTSLKEFGNWLKKFPKYSFNTTDHIMLVTRYPINKGVGFLNGYTWKSGLCTDKGISIIQEKFDFSVALAATQLIAYNIGVNFDGQENECDPMEGFIMSSQLNRSNLNQNLFNVFQFSDCSINQLQKYFRKNQLLGKCLRNSSKVSALDSFYFTRPGQRIAANEQCLMQFGNTSNIYQCEKENFKNRYNFCTEMFCPYKGICKGILALEGTSCGTKMWCYNGRCRSHSKAPDLSRKCWLGNKKISVKIANKIYLCKDITYGKGNLCYNDEIRKQCCRSCSYFYTGVPGCEYGDRIEECWSRECFFYSKIKTTSDCCRTCSFMPKSSSADHCFNVSHILRFLFEFIFYFMRQCLLYDK